MTSANVPTNEFKEQRDRAKLIFWILGSILVVFIGIFIWFKVGPPEKVEDHLKWIEWLLVGGGGALVYLLREASNRYPYISEAEKYGKAFDEAKDDDERKDAKEKKEKTISKADYISYTPWYFTSFLRGVIIVMVLMFALTNVKISATIFKGSDSSQEEITDDQDMDIPEDVDEDTVEDFMDEEADIAEAPNADNPEEEEEPPADVESEEEMAAEPEEEDTAADIAFDLSKADQTAKLVAAFILGYFNRLGLHLIKVVGRALFPEAWKKAYPDDE